MTKRDKRLFFISAIVGLVVVFISAVAPRMRPYYGIEIGLIPGNIVLTCVSQDPVFERAKYYDKIPPRPAYPEIDVMIACWILKARNSDVLDEDFPGLGMPAFEWLVYTIELCDQQSDLEFVDKCRSAHYESLEYLIEQGVSVDRGQFGDSRLLSAIIGRDEEMFSFLLSHGADPDFPTRNDSEETAMNALANLISGEYAFGDADDRELWKRMLLLAEDQN